MKHVTVAVLLAALGGLHPPGAAQDFSTILFLVADPQKFDTDSYVLPLSDPAAIADARALVQLGSGSGVGSIVIARVAAGADGINRDHRADGAPAWSWHVTEFLEFADATIELCDGSPTLVEADVEGWLANTNSTVCFWSYTVVEELGPLEADDATWGALKAAFE